ncbi:(2Fe-2S)-binding protein [Actinosynnema sp. NPDC023658]|uniref:(2Fe-2S)-binding protein n=1 Tax=Actinosynnema sp. NPDC023658 TaxID=3155465 RepID=UPI0033CBEA33
MIEVLRGGWELLLIAWQESRYRLVLAVVLMIAQASAMPLAAPALAVLADSAVAGDVRVDVARSLEPVVERVHAVTSVARGLLWGNAGSSMAGALRTVSRSAISRGAGGSGADGHSGVGGGTDWLAVADELFADPPLKGTGEFIPFPGEVVFRRRSCCLYYRLDGGGTCGDCPLSPR